MTSPAPHLPETPPLNAVSLGMRLCTWILGTRHSQHTCLRVFSSHDDDTVTQSCFLPLTYNFQPHFTSNV